VRWYKNLCELILHRQTRRPVSRVCAPLVIPDAGGLVTYSLAYLDRCELRLWRGSRMADALQHQQLPVSLSGSLFFFGYFLFQIPGAAYARRKSATRLIFFALISWARWRH